MTTSTKDATCPSCGGLRTRRAKICRSCHTSTLARSGSANSRWKGGRRHDGYGYVRLWMPDHPEAINGTVAEHRVVMEQIIGRPLRPDENVHHRNGVRDDNRPENLELWAKTQPAGQRVADLLAWAREIEARYGDAPAIIIETTST